MEQSQLFDKGLSSQKAKTLLTQYGYNEISEVKQFTLIKSFIGQFDNILILLLIGAGGISFFVGERLDSLFIFLIVILNAFFGLYQEYKAEKALSHLKKLTAAIIRVIRDKKEQEIDSRHLVSGDLTYIEEGDLIKELLKTVKDLKDDQIIITDRLQKTMKEYEKIIKEANYLSKYDFDGELTNRDYIEYIIREGSMKARRDLIEFLSIPKRLHQKKLAS